MMWGVLIAAVFAGIISGMGIGGGVLLIPALLFLTDLNQQQVQGVNLLYFLPTAIIALVQHVRAKRVRIEIAKPLLAVGWLGALGGAALAVWLDATLLRRIFGGFLFVMGWMELCKRKPM